MTLPVTAHRQSDRRLPWIIVSASSTRVDDRANGHPVCRGCRCGYGLLPADLSPACGRPRRAQSYCPVPVSMRV